VDVSFDDIGGSEVRGERWMLVLMILVVQRLEVRGGC
jgi:hypothetical protein